MMKSMIFVASLMIAVASAAIDVSVCPDNGGHLQLSDTGLSATPGFTPNLLFYNGGGQDLKSGSPRGPYFSFADNCYFVPNSTLNCDLILYRDSAHTQQIGTGNLFSESLALGAAYSSSIYFIGGSARLRTHITDTSSAPTPDVNFHDLDTTIYFQPQDVHPTGGTLVVNTVAFSSSESGILSLWGSNGWNGSEYDFETRTTGVDFRGNFFCPPPPIVPCPPCSNPADNFVVASSGITNGVPLTRSSSDTCITLSFTA
jgi:hypothetical protein